MKTPIIHTSQVPPDSIWCIGQAEHTPRWRREMEKKVRRGEYVKVRASWQNISPFKTVFIPIEPPVVINPARPDHGDSAAMNITEPQP